MTQANSVGLSDATFCDIDLGLHSLFRLVSLNDQVVSSPDQEVMSLNPIRGGIQLMPATVHHCTEAFIVSPASSQTDLIMLKYM